MNNKETTLGVLNPWGLKQVEETQTFDEKIKEKFQRGRTPVAIQGRQYHLLITLPVSFKKEDSAVGNATEAAMHVLGEFFERAKCRRLTELLKDQKLAFIEEHVIGPRISFELGPTKIFAAASSSNIKLAQAMALDRLALAFTIAKLTIKGFKELMKEHYLEVVRNT